MKRLVFIFAFLLCCFAIQANARGIMTMCGAGVPSGCNTLLEQTTGGSNVIVGWDTTVDRYYATGSFVPTSSGSIKTAYVNMKRSGTPADTMTITALLCPDNDGAPAADASCTAMTTVIYPKDLSTEYAAVKYTYATGYAVTASTKYWIKLRANQVAAQYAIVEYYSTGSQWVGYSADDSTWTSSDTTAHITITIKDCVE